MLEALLDEQLGRPPLGAQWTYRGRLCRVGCSIIERTSILCGNLLR